MEVKGQYVITNTSSISPLLEGQLLAFQFIGGFVFHLPPRNRNTMNLTLLSLRKTFPSTLEINNPYLPIKPSIIIDFFLPEIDLSNQVMKQSILSLSVL